uniref:Retrovirus-related Pol polyprotein from transposon TNT 1-94-like beta-barrel domain-containing protein n=1 Tax=Cajanus cajan TaxID=3821 RepID=A0A151T5J1_CAJCA|nr:hypothetical protein KK1_016854 [Cajanus cajan]
MKGKISLNTIGPVSQGIWILDSGATDHMTHFRVIFNSYVKRNREQLITVTNGKGVLICGFGNIILESSIVLKDVLHGPQLANSFISVVFTAKEQSGLYLLESMTKAKQKS